MPTTLYNDNDRYTCAWLRNLIAAGALADGTVDPRSIADLAAADIAGYRRAHFFAGIGGWEYALRLAGWPDERPVWTGSCPCQPFSAAGKRKAEADERHLWPQWFRLIRECHPDTIIGEQVEGAVGLGWLDRVFADLEAEGYACGAAVLGAHSLGAPHIRQRLFWVADAGGFERGLPERRGRLEVSEIAGCGETFGLGHTLGARLEKRAGERRDDGPQCAPAERADGNAGGLGDAASEQMGRARQPWADGVWLPCLDGKARRVEPGIQPLATGLPAAVDGLGSVSRVGALRGAGNAIVPQAAAEFVSAFLACST